MSRPRLITEDERQARRRAQYRNAKRKKAGLPPEPTIVPPGCRPVSVLVGSRWVPALIDPEGRRVFLT
jgi:hypothetical protein